MAMSIQLFGHRVLLKYEKLKEASIGGIVIPDVAGKHDLHRTGRVQFLGNGRVFDPYKKQTEVIPSLVRVGDLVMFQINDVMRWAQIYRHLEDDMLHMLQTELIARINGEQVNLATFEILGDYVLVKPEVRQPKSKIVMPDTIKQAEMIHYTAIQKGSTVDLPFEEDQEIICNHGRVNPIFIPVHLPDGTAKQEEFGYVFKDFVHGVVDNDHALQA
jgi:co-chaperonin GroES (HSP10)